MAGLGLILSWGGYLLFVWGYSKTKGAYSGISLSIPDLALPSHRTRYINGMQVINAGNPGLSNGGSGIQASPGVGAGVVGGLAPGQLYPGSPGGGGGGFSGEGIVGGLASQGKLPK